MCTPSSSARSPRCARVRRHATPVAIALAMLLTGCAGGDDRETAEAAEVEALREQLATLVEQDLAREQRLEDLEAVAQRLTRADPPGRLTEAERELARLGDTLTAFDEELVEHNAELLEANEQLRGTVEELRDQLDTARGRIDRVSGEIEDLEIRYETLRDRLDRVGS